MLNRGQENNELFLEIKNLLSLYGLDVVEATRFDQKGKTNLLVVLYKKEGEINTDDLERAYNIIYPRYEVLMGDRDLSLEVSSPGLQRNFKDYYEFKVFKDKNVRLYSTLYSSYITGVISSSDDNSVTLTNYLIEDKKESGDEIILNFDTIAKAKLDCKWEEKK